MRCTNRQFGTIDYENEHVFVFADGIIGFEHLKRFLIVNDADAEPFRWLVPIDDQDICLPILDPTFVTAEYGTLERFVEGATVAVVAALKEPIEESTVNLRSPIVFDAEKRTGKQVILDDERLAIQYKFIAAPQPVAGEESC
ncbi:MAG: flagellar assembly protein FliW [Ignavibacteriae bacterium]|nr:flagellar assembly protein FliW [Ignavibacteriota bacterium]